MLVAESDIHKTTLRAGASSLCEFTCMLLRLSNSVSSFCYSLEMCLGDQQLMTVWLYLDDICVYAASIGQVVDGMEMVFSRLKEFHLNSKLKKYHFFQCSSLLGVMNYLQMVSLHTTKK